MLKRHSNIKWTLFAYDVVIILAVELLLLEFSGETIPYPSVVYHMGMTCVCVFAARFAGKIYSQVWRYGGIQCYMRLLATDAVAFVFNYFLEQMLIPARIPFARLAACIAAPCCEQLRRPGQRQRPLFPLRVMMIPPHPRIKCKTLSALEKTFQQVFKKF